MELGKYDPTDVQSIVEYAQALEGHTLRELTELEQIADPKRRRGSFGNAVEEYYFRYSPNSDPGPDFAEAGVELKCTPLKELSGGRLAAKERLVLTMIDYEAVVDETFETSHLVEKARDILLVSYLWERDKDPLDYEVKIAELWGLPSEDMEQFRLDWETVVNKVRAGHAEDISGSDTLYLEACTKAANSSVRRSQPFSDVPAKPRAWALKASYMTAAENAMLEKRERISRAAGEEGMGVLDLVRARFAPYLGRTEAELAGAFGLSRSKDLCARVTRHILGVADDARIEEFEKAGIVPKTMRLRASGMPKEDAPFKAFDYFELEATPFAESELYADLQRKYLFVIYREDAAGEYRLADVCLWQMPDADLEEAERCYEQMRRNVREGRAETSVRSTENRCCHVRPHARNAADTRPQPHGDPVVKKSFWLNKRYLKDQIEKALNS